MPQPAPSQPSKSSPLVWILLLLVFAGAVFAGWWFFLRGGAGGAAPALLSRAIPAEATTVVGVNPQALLRSGLVEQALAKTGTNLAELRAKLADAKIDLDSFQTVVVGVNPADESGVLATQGEMDVAALKGLILAASAANAELAKVANQVQFEGFDGGLVLVGRGDVYNKALAVARGESQGTLDPKIAETAAAVDMSAPIWAAGVIPAETPVGEPMVTSQLGGTPTHAAISLDPTDRLVIRVSLLIPGADASKAATNLTAMIGMLPASMLPDGAGEALKGLVLNGQGEVLSASLTLSAELLEKLAALAP
jgi:hypothetical protein